MSSASRMPVYKVTVLGEGGVGKTALTLQMCLNHFVETYDPTIEDSYRKQIQIQNAPCVLEILDTAGQEEYTALREQWIRDGQGFFLVYSIASRATFEGLRKLVEQIIRVKDVDIREIPIILVGNKADMVSLREVRPADANLFARALGCSCIETSAKTGMHVEAAFYNLVNLMEQTRGKDRRKSEVQRSCEPSQNTLVQRDTSHSTEHSRDRSRKNKKKCLVM